MNLNNNDDMQNEKLNKKINHIFNVAKYIKYISDNINLNNKDVIYKMHDILDNTNNSFNILKTNAFEKLYIDQEENDENIVIVKELYNKGLDLRDSESNSKIYFPLQSNENQNSILNKIEETNNVVVYGANGTGKTQSIINLASHFMAKGNKILITYPNESKCNYINRFTNEYKKLIYSSEKDIRNSIRYINDIIENKDELTVARRIELFANEIKNHKSGVILLRNEMKHCELQQGYEILDSNGVKHLPMYIYNTHKINPIFRDYIKYTTNTIIQNNKKYVQIIPDFSIKQEDILTLRDQRDKVIKNLRDYIYDCKLLPYMLSGKEFEQICKDLKEVDKINNKIIKEDTGITLLKDSAEYVEYVEQLKRIVTMELYIKSDWQKEILHELQDIDSSKSARYYSLYNKLEKMMQDVRDANNKIDSKYIISLSPNWNIEELYRKIDEFVELKSHNNVFKKVFDNKLHKFETEIKVNGRNAKNASKEELEQIRNTVKYYYEVYKFITNMEEIANTLEIPIKYEQNYTHITIEKLLEKYNQFAQIFKYEQLVKDLQKESNRLIKIDESRELLNNKLPCTYYKLYMIVAMHYQKEKYRDSIKKYKKMIEDFDNLEKENQGYQLIKDIKKCLENYNDNIFMARWYQIYSHLTEVEKYRDVFDDFKNSIDVIYSHLPKYAEDLLDIQIPTLTILPENLNESIKEAVELEYVDNLSLMEKKLEELSKKICNEEQSIKSLKAEVISLNIEHAILQNINESNKKVIKDYLDLDEKEAANYLKNENNLNILRDIIPIWVIPEDKTIQLKDKQNYFDYILIDEANKLNILDISLLTLAKKSISFGDLNQLCFNEINKDIYNDISKILTIEKDAKKQFLVDENELLSDLNIYNLKSNLLKVLTNLIAKNYQVTLTEQYVNMPKIIDICNTLMYDNKIIPVNVLDVNNYRYPLLKEVYVNDINIDFKNDINNNEVTKIITILKEAIKSKTYINKTFGIISMFSLNQEKAIEEAIKKNLSIEQMKEIKLKVGMPQDFEDDSRDVIIASMNNTKLDDIKEKSIDNIYNSKLIVETITRAREQLILVHSIDKIKCSNKKDSRYILIDTISNYDIKPLYTKNLEEQCDSQFTIEIYKFLLRKEYKVIPEYTIDNYLINLLVLKNNQKFAIKCYGTKYYSEEEWEENRYREQQLEKLGWKFYRILGTSFYKNKPLLLDALDKTLIDNKMF